jgi:single-strand DNA-binding protein
MSNSITLIGNVTRDPELRFTSSGQPTASFGIAVNRRWQNQAKEWEEAVSFFNVVCWRELAENVAESCPKGTRVMVNGRLEQRAWETPTGEKKSSVDVIADECGPSLRWASAQVSRKERSTSTANDTMRASNNVEAPPSPQHGYDEEPF